MISESYNGTLPFSYGFGQYKSFKINDMTRIYVQNYQLCFSLFAYNLITLKKILNKSEILK